MYRFWPTVIRPVFEALRPKEIVEIGASDGKNTRNLLEYCRENGAALHTIDPQPLFDVPAWQKEYGDRLKVHQCLSLNALPLIDRFDVVLIDGDHNWYTVLNELRLIEQRAEESGEPFPLVLLHDTGWPYARRDLYYNPETIPTASRKPYKKEGIRLNTPELQGSGGLNAHLNNSIYENNLQNGVLTAVEDFIKESRQVLELMLIPGLSGFGILVASDLRQRNRELDTVLASLVIPPYIRDHVESLEKHRILTEISLADTRTALRKKEGETEDLRRNLEKAEEGFMQARTALQALEASLQKKSGIWKAQRRRLRRLIEVKQAELEELRQALEAVRMEMHSVSEALQEREAELIRAREQWYEVERREAEQKDQIAALSRRLEQQQCEIEELTRAREQLYEAERREVEQKDQIAALSRRLEQQQRETQQLARWLGQLHTGIIALLTSKRWKMGNALGELWRVLLLKRPEATAAEYLQEVLRKFVAWRQIGQEERSPERPLVPAAPQNKTPRSDVPASETVTAIILNRNGSNHLHNLFISFLQYNTYPYIDFVVVDHASSDNSLKILSAFQKHLAIDVVALRENHSFSYSNNLAARRSRGKYPLFLNNDVIFTSDVIYDLVQRLQNPEIGVVGTRLLYPGTDPRYPGQLQHAGILFREDIAHEFHRPYNLGAKAGWDATEASPSLVPAVTGAMMLCRNEEFLSLGGFCEEYLYGYEDVDLCLTYRRKLKKASLVANELSLIHAESSTQRQEDSNSVQERRRNNIAIFQKRYGYALKRAYVRDRVAGTLFCSEEPLVVAFAVTEAHLDARAGDYFTALELALACKAEFGWKVKFLARNEDWYNLEDIDVLVVMVDVFDLSKMRNAKPGLIKIAWMRNWFDRWAGRPCFDHYDIFLCSSAKAAEYIRTNHNKHAHVFQIATNEKRFQNGSAQSRFASDYCFTGSYWGAPRDIEEMVNPAAVNYRFALFGHGWEKHERLRTYWRGFVRYDEMPDVYASTRIVIDDANHVTKPWGSVNSRVFDALAAGVLVITNGEAGAREVFGGLLPTYQTREELQTLLDRYLGDEAVRRELVAQLQREVLEKHTYARRARELRSILLDYCEHRFRIAIKVPAPNPQVAHEWGDYHFALALKRSLVKEGHSVRIDLLCNWDTPLGFGDDVVLVLRGLSRYKPKPYHINLMWNISHPDKVKPEEYDQYDHVFIASSIYVEKLQKEVRCPVSALLQCTDPSLFYPEAPNGVPAHGLLFVGNSRKQFRAVVKDALEAKLPIAVYGSRWEGLIPSDYIKGVHIPNTELRRYYSSCKILLNDHWPTMRERGFISNRIFDAAACGSFIISDEVSGAAEIFGDALVTFKNSADLKRKVEQFAPREEERKTYGEKLREIVLTGHTFDHRAGTILQTVSLLDECEGFLLPPKKDCSFASLG